jgi:bacterioferritin
MEGAVTDGYQADPQKVVSTLNMLRANELVAYLQYKAHAYTVFGPDMHSLEQEFNEHAGDEFAHAEALAERISQLNGVPVVKPASIDKISTYEVDLGKNNREMLEQDLIDEQRAIEAYQNAISEIGMDDPATRALLEGILQVEFHHARELNEMLESKAPVQESL